MATRFIDVLVPVALDQTYSYRVPDGLALAPGDLVACRWVRAAKPWASSGQRMPTPIRVYITA